MDAYQQHAQRWVAAHRIQITPDGRLYIHGDWVRPWPRFEGRNVHTEYARFAALVSA